MKKLILLFMLTICVSISFAQYTPMTAAGYQFKRILCDSTLHIPSFCGIPTLRNSTAKNGAIAMDTCNFKIYMWTNQAGWGEIIGAGTDTTSLSNRIDQRVKYTDTAAMLLAYLRKVDTTNKWVANVTKVNDSTIRVFKGGTITDLKILGKPTDTTSLSNRINLKLNISDTATMLSPYLRKADTSAMLSKYLRKTDTASLSNRINLKLNISDTATMLSKYLRKVDTTDKWVSNVTKKNDSTITIFKGTTATDIMLPRGTGGGGGGSGTVTSVGSGYGLSGGPITSSGTLLVDSATLSTKYLRRADTAVLVATKSNIAGKLNISDTATMLSKYLRKTDTASLSNRINLKLNISDTATMLSKYLRKTDTASLSNRINLKLNISDTATMLSKYLRKTDTASLSNRINLKLNISDTANKWVNSVTKINDTAIRVWKGNTSSVISFAKDVVYTENPIMSKVSNDSNIIYFNPDTAAVWRGGGGGTTPGLQEVLTQGKIYSDGTFITTLCDQYSPDNFYVFNSIFDGKDWIKAKLNISNYSSEPYFEFGQFDDGSSSAVDNIDLRPSSLKMQKIGNYPYYLSNTDNYTDTSYLSLPYNVGLNYSKYDTIATLRNLRDTAAAIRADIVAGSGTVTSVATGYGLSGGTITTSGTLVVDTATLSNKYARLGQTQNGRFGNDTATVVMAKIHNNSGGTLSNGQVVFLATSGTNADAPSVRLANNKHDSTSANTFGFVSGSIASNDTGYIILSGKIEKLNTSAFSNGDIIYLDSVSGQWTKTKPVAPYHMVYLGVVVKSNNGNGSIFVKCQNGYELDEIHDVKITSKLNNEVLAYSDTQKVWKNRNIYTIVDSTSIIATKYGTDTMRTNIYNSLNAKASIDTSTYYLIADANTTSTTAVNTNLTFNMAANEVRRIMISGTCSKATSSTGLKLAIGAPTGATIKAVQNASSNAISTQTYSIISAINTLGTTMNTAIATEMPFRIEGIITNGSTAGAVTLQFATVTSNTATIYAGTLMSVSKVKGL